MRREEIADLLPEIYRRGLAPGTTLFALLCAMEALLVPCEAALDALPNAFDPYRANDAFVRLLARWTDFGGLLSGSGEAARLSSGADRLRLLVAAKAELSRWRGTARGLNMILELATGVEGVTVEDRVMAADGAPIPFHVRIVVPHGAALHRELLGRIVETEKPAHVTYEIIYEMVDASRPAA